MPIELLWRGPQPILGVMTFAPGTGATARFAPVTLGAEAIQGDPIAIFQDPRTEELATAVTCGMCRRALSSDGRLLAAAPDTVYRISEVSPAGKAVRSWTRADAAASRRTDAEIEAVEKRRAAGSAGSRRPGRANRPAPIIPRGDIRFRPRVQGFGIDAAGRLLALVNNAGSARPVVDVFGADGRHLGTVQPAETLTAMVVRGKRVAALAENDDGEHVIHVYRIE